MADDDETPDDEIFEHYTGPCPYCDGTGWDDGPCLSCDGVGWID